MGTYTGTQTFARFSLLALQVKSMLSNAAGASEDSVQRVYKGLLPPHYIEQIAVRGVFPNGKLGAELRISIDWREHTLQIAAGGEKMQVPKNWVQGIAPDMKHATDVFVDICKSAKMAAEWVVWYDRSFNADEVDKILGFTTAKSREWQSPPESMILNLGPLKEARFVISVAN